MRRIDGLIGTGLLLVATVGVPPASATAATPLCDGRVATVVGTDAADVLIGTAVPDVMSGLGGNDTLHGLGGDDVLCGDDGADVLEGGDGADRLFGGLDEAFQTEDGFIFEGGDTVRPGAGDDHVDLGQDSRPAEGDPSTERLDYREVSHAVTVDLTRGLAFADGTDSLVVQGTHHVLATPYDDVLIGTIGRDYLCGGGGDDELRGLAGSDLLDADGFLGDDCYLFPQTSARSTGDDRVDGGTGSDVLFSSGGDDLLIGSGGDDYISGLNVDGHLEARGGAGRDRVVLLLDRAADLSVSAGAGQDDLVINRTPDWQREQVSVPLALDLGRGTLRTPRRRVGTLRAFENVGLLRDSHDPWRVVGTSGNNWIEFRRALAPVIAFGRGGKDNINGGAGDDLLDGGPGEDYLFGGRGVDRCLHTENWVLCEALR